MRLILSILAFIGIVSSTRAQTGPSLVLLPGDDPVFSVSGSAECLSDSTGRLSLSQVCAAQYVSAFSPPQTRTDDGASVHWLRFSAKNKLSQDSLFYVGVTFTDDITLYECYPGGIRAEKSGDLVPIPRRSVSNGEMAFVTLRIPYGQTRNYYLRLESSTPLSRQFKGPALRNIRLFPQAVYKERFIDNRIFQALFFGACLIMLFYNAFMAVILRERSYLYYVAYLGLLIIFFASNNGYLAEWLLPWQPRVDLYIRFLVTPLLLLFYLLFSRTYLMSALYAPRLHRATGLLLWALPLLLVLMLVGHWYLGRTLAVLVALVTLPLVFGIALQSLKHAYIPGRYFLAAHGLLLAGGVAFSLQRLSPAGGSPLTQYGIQIGLVLELALFSLGLAHRIQLFRQQLAEKQLENERLERLRIFQLQQLTQEQNRDLEQKVMARTAEVVAQKEEIHAQVELLAQHNEELTAAQETINLQNIELSRVNQLLEYKVRLRTQELVDTNAALQKSNGELDWFIYRTAHDIKGPLARLQGLSYVGLMEVADEGARGYLQKLFSEAKNLHAILARLSTIHEIRHQQLHPGSIAFEPLLNSILAELQQIGEYAGVRVEITAENIPLFQSDSTLIRFVLRALLENALKFSKKPATEAAFVAVHVGACQQEVRIRVSDNGIGIEPEQAPRIFDLFSPAAKVYQSHGLGLYMARLTAERLGGSIRLVPAGEDLTVFEVTLPFGGDTAEVVPPLSTVSA